VEVQEDVSLQVKAASGEEDSNKVTESEMPISQGGSTIYAIGMQEQNQEERKWNQIHSAWSDNEHLEEMQYQYRAVIISVADILPCKNPNLKIKKDKACKIGISQLNKAGQIVIKRLLEILTDVPQPLKDA
jgi:hypothetical protein